MIGDDRDTQMQLSPVKYECVRDAVMPRQVDASMNDDDRDMQMQLSPVTYEWVRDSVMPSRVRDAYIKHDLMIHKLMDHELNESF